MLRTLLTLLLAPLALVTACPALTNTSPLTPATPHPTPATPPADSGNPKSAIQNPKSEGSALNILLIDVREPIDDPVLYVIRRGLKEAAEKNYDTVILNMKTPGGSVGTTLEIIEAIKKFPGKTITYINDEAISAGAIIAAGTNEIWLSPQGVIGASAAVASGGQDIQETMRLKVTSFLRGKVRAITEGYGYRGQVIEAMIDKDFELKIGDQILKAKGELLSLTATEAIKTYGTPPETLLAAGIAKNIDDLLQQKYGASNYTLTKLETTWAEKLGSFLSSLIGQYQFILLGLGLLALFIEFKTPGFGFFGVAGIVLLGLVFLLNYGAGLSGYEPMIVFALGILLIIAELLLFPGTMIPVITGLVLMLGALVWAMADIWPNAPLNVTWSADTFARPITNLGLGLLVSVVIGALIIRFLPKGWFFERLAVTHAIAGSAQVAGLAPETAQTTDSLIGTRATATTALMPSGQIEIDGKFYNARLDMGHAPAGTKLTITRVSDFCLIVEADKTT